MRVAAGIAALVLAAIAALHYIWVFTPWPLADRAAMARYVVGTPEDKLPPGPLTAAAATLIAAAGYLIAARAGLLPEIGPHWAHRAGPFVIAAALGLRGLGGLVMSGIRPGPFADFNRLDLRYYSPLCLALAGISLWVALS